MQLSISVHLGRSIKYIFKQLFSCNNKIWTCSTVIVLVSTNLCSIRSFDWLFFFFYQGLTVTGQSQKHGVTEIHQESVFFHVGRLHSVQYPTENINWCDLTFGKNYKVKTTALQLHLQCQSMCTTIRPTGESLRAAARVCTQSSVPRGGVCSRTCKKTTIDPPPVFIPQTEIFELN